MTRFLGLKIRERPVSGLLEAHGIAKPSTILANLIALRIAKEPADPGRPYKGQGIHVMELRDGRKIEVSLIDSNTKYGDLANWHLGFKGVKVGLPGPHEYKSVEFFGDDAKLVIHQFHQWRIRSINQRNANQDASNEDNALTIIEGMV